MEGRDTVARIKERLDIVDIISSYIDVHRAGKHVKANCPFHKEKTPSFFISPERQSYYCFGCGAKGDMFSFIQNYEGLDFLGALTLLADRAGVTIERIDPAHQTEKNEHLELLARASAYFRECLQKSSVAKEYLKTRELDGEPAQFFQIGYAPDGWRKLYEHFTEQGVTETALLAVGLIKKNEEGKVYDVFRNRIIFPITDTSGRVVGFSGRVLPGADDSAPKYLNTPETALFQKSSLLYGYDKAKTSMRRLDAAILVEGQTDVIACHKAGYTNTVAPLGTALTERHITLIKRMTSNVLFALDADRAGINAMARGAHLALAGGCDVKVAALPDGSDPADIVNRDIKEWKEIVKSAVHVVPFMLAYLRTHTSDDRAYQKKVRTEVLPFVARIDDGIDRAHFIKIVAEKLKVGEAVIAEEVAKVTLDEINFEESDMAPSVEDSPHMSRPDAIAIQIKSAILVSKDEGQSSEWEQRLHALIGRTVDRDAFVDAHIFEIESTFEDSSALSLYVDELFLILERELVNAEIVRLRSELQQLERAGDDDGATKTLEAIGEQQRTLEALTQKIATHHS